MIRDLIRTEEEAPQTSIVKLRHSQILTNGGTQMRAGINETTADEYADELRHGVTFPPVVVFYDGEHYWLGDGFHRVRAYFLLRGAEAEIPADVRPGTRRDAILCAAGANAVHGLRRTNADKRRAVQALLFDDEWSKWSDREIARRCHVSAPLVAEVRSKVVAGNLYSEESENLTVNSYSDNTEPIAQQATERTYTTKHGTTATMNTANIGEKVSFVAVWTLEQAVQRAVTAFWSDDEQPDVAGNLRALMELVDWEKQDLGRAILRQVEGKFDYRKRDLVQAINNVRSQAEQRQAAQERQKQFAAQEETSIQPAKQAELPEDLVAAGAKLEQLGNTYFAKYPMGDWGYTGSPRFATWDEGEAWLRKEHERHKTRSNDRAAKQIEPADSPTPPATSTPAKHMVRQARIQELLRLYREALATVSEFGDLTGEFTVTTGFERGLRLMIDALERNCTGELTAAQSDALPTF